MLLGTGADGTYTISVPDPNLLLSNLGRPRYPPVRSLEHLVTRSTSIRSPADGDVALWITEIKERREAACCSACSCLVTTVSNCASINGAIDLAILQNRTQLLHQSQCTMRVHIRRLPSHVESVSAACPNNTSTFGYDCERGDRGLYEIHVKVDLGGFHV